MIPITWVQFGCFILIALAGGWVHGYVFGHARGMKKKPSLPV